MKPGTHSINSHSKLHEDENSWILIVHCLKYPLKMYRVINENAITRAERVWDDLVTFWLHLMVRQGWLQSVASREVRTERFASNCGSTDGVRCI